MKLGIVLGCQTAIECQEEILALTLEFNKSAYQLKMSEQHGFLRVQF